MIQFETLNQWLEWLEASQPTSDIELGLLRVAKVAKKLDLAKLKVPVISVAGTNGKGSVVATLESLAKAHQLKIGSYTSPHLIKFNERVKINGTPVSDEVLCQAFSQIANGKGEIKLTYFEFTTLVGLYCFSQTELDFIALEVGLGGRLDAVNIIDADVAVITSIGLDHTDWLGDNLEDIAYEKAGIARKNKPLVVAEQKLLPLLDKAIQAIKPSLLIENQDYQLATGHGCWSYHSKQLQLERAESSSLLETNQAAALTAFLQLFPKKDNQSLTQQALSQAALVGRFSRLNEQPLIILDVAHNPDSAELLNANIRKLKQKRSAKVWAICGMLKDKDIETSLSQLTALDHWLCIDLAPPRGAKASELCEVLNALELPKNDVNQFGELESAYQFFINNAEESDMLVVFGSFVTVGQMLEYWQQA